ncbi:MAG: recombinase [Bacteroidia bacterium]|nr:recombinase [Bacteroidia bacterium]
MKAATKVYSEKRNGIEKNVPLQMHIFFNGKRVSVFSTGFRCDVDMWDTDKQQMKRNTINKSGETAATINGKIKALRGSVDVWAANNPNGTIEELLKELRKVAGKKEKTEPKVFLDIYGHFDRFLKERKLSENRHEHYLVLKRALQRFEAYSGQSFTFDIDLYQFEQFLSNETTKKKSKRGINTVIGLMSKLRSFFLWAIDNELTLRNPFNKFKIGEAKYGTPFFITIEERNHLYNFDFKARKQLGIQRDIFVFQCLIGCRVSDLYKLTSANVINGFIEYIAIKTSDENPKTIRVPLTDTAKEIINRYKGGETLLPFISEVNYNLAIKEMFLLAGLTRIVTVLNTKTRKDEQKPLNEVASSHLARRAFIGNLYAKVQDPNVVGSMSGHVEGSKAFARYRNINDEIKTDVMKLIQ